MITAIIAAALVAGGAIFITSVGRWADEAMERIINNDTTQINKD